MQFIRIPLIKSLVNLGFILSLVACGGGGSGSLSSAATAPAAPTNLIATAGDSRVELAFVSPTSNGGAAITGYNASCTSGALSFTGAASASPVSVAGLSNGTAYTCVVTATNAIATSAASASVMVTPVLPTAMALTYPIVSTNQTKFYNSTGQEISAPQPGAAFYGQDANYVNAAPSYTDNGDGTVTDKITGLMWVKARGSKGTWDAAVAGAAVNRTGGYSDWRMPSIKELYSLFLHSGVNGSDYMSTLGFIPFIDTNYFDFQYGSGIGVERVIDAQDWSGTEYVGTTQDNQPKGTVFGINFADGRSKGYKKTLPPLWTAPNDELYVRYVRGNTKYGINAFKSNGDRTVSDSATGLMWSQDDSKEGFDWPGAMAWVAEKNKANYLGHNDWRLPNIKELHSIVDFTRSPQSSSSPAIDINFFNTSTITNEAGQQDYPYFWSGTVLVDGPSREGAYIPFGRAMAKLDGVWQDVHGAGSQKSDVMVGSPANYPNGRGPQFDAVRIYNYVRLVRDI